MSSVTPIWRPSHDHPRAIAIGLIYRHDCLLCAEVTRDDGSIKGYRPLGGGIEMGETAEDALIREFKEEVEATIKPTKRLAVLENIFEHQGHLGHEIVFVYKANLIETGAIEPTRFLRRENGRVTALDWIPTKRFISGDAELFPDGLLSHL